MISQASILHIYSPVIHNYQAELINQAPSYFCHVSLTVATVAWQPEGTV